jgi:hypothetical protein
VRVWKATQRGVLTAFWPVLYVSNLLYAIGYYEGQLTGIGLALVAAIGMSDMSHGRGGESDDGNEGLHVDGKVSMD